MLEDELIREKEGKEMEIIALAAEKAKQILYENHQYSDGKVDQPILTPESLEYIEQLEQEEDSDEL